MKTYKLTALPIYIKAETEDEAWEKFNTGDYAFQSDGTMEEKE